jgi:protein MpaA
MVGMGRRYGAVWGAAAVLACSTGCRAPVERVQMADGERGPVQVAPQQSVIGWSVEGRPIDCLDFGSGSDVTMILATIHGSESAGTPLVRRLGDCLSRRPDLLQGRRVVLIPVANPDGLARGTRRNARGVDLNRNFPAKNYLAADHHGTSALSEPESSAIRQALGAYRPTRIVSIHQPLACIDYDGPAERLAEAMAGHVDLPVKKLGGRPGSLGSYAGILLGIPIITVELPAAAGDLDADTLWARYGRMLVAAIRFPESMSETVDAAAE